MSKFSEFTNATKHILSTFDSGKGGFGGMALKGAAIGGGIGAAYGGISDNHTALGMGLAGAGLGFGAGREYAGLKAWQSRINNMGTGKQFSRPDKPAVAGKASGMDHSFSYAKNRFNTLGD